MKAFLGFVQWYSMYIDCFGHLSASLTDALRGLELKKTGKSSWLSLSELNFLQRTGKALHLSRSVSSRMRFIRFGSPRSPIAVLSPACRLPVAFLALLVPCRSPFAFLLLPCCSPVAPVSLSFRSPVAVLPPSCPYPVASCCFLSFLVAMLLSAWRLLVALLSLSRRSFRALSCRYFLLPPCRPPVACLLSSCRFSVASLLPPWCFSVAQ